ncbi:hypothetical protein AS132_02490 [Photobacterium sanguinicancri]|nr:hypothetical protein AS132_02490 [Photobacterium sanguinicancri]
MIKWAMFEDSWLNQISPKCSVAMSNKPRKLKIRNVGLSMIFSTKYVDGYTIDLNENYYQLDF